MSQLHNRRHSCQSLLLAAWLQGRLLMVTRLVCAQFLPSKYSSGMFLKHLSGASCPSSNSLAHAFYSRQLPTQYANVASTLSHRKRALIHPATKGKAGDIDIDALLDDAEALGQLRSQLTREMSVAQQQADIDSDPPASTAEPSKPPSSREDLKASFNGVMYPEGRGAPGSKEVNKVKKAPPSSKAHRIANEISELQGEQVRSGRGSKSQVQSAMHVWMHAMSLAFGASNTCDGRREENVALPDVDGGPFDGPDELLGCMTLSFQQRAHATSGAESACTPLTPCHYFHCICYPVCLKR